MRYSHRCLLVLMGVAILLPWLHAGADSRFEDTIKKTLNVLDKISATLATVKDEDSAKKAQPDLRKMADEFLALRKEAEKPPPPSKEVKDRLAKDYKSKIEDADKKLLGEITRVDALPGGRDALKEVREMMKKSEEKKTSEKKTDEKK